MLQEIQVERVSKQGLVGHIYKGCVSRVMPGMDAAFVDIGLSKAAFIHSSDVAFLPKSSRGKRSEINQSDETILLAPNDNITNLLHEGQQLLVQVVKDQLGTKVSRITTN
mgnify:FL=1